MRLAAVCFGIMVRRMVYPLNPPLGKWQAYALLLQDLRRVADSGNCLQVVQAVLDATEYFDYLQKSDPGTYETRRENVEELVSAAQTFTEESDDPSLGAFLEEISLLSDIDSMQDKLDQVTLMTLHSAMLK